MKVAVLVNEMNIRGGTHKQVVRLCQSLRDEGIPFQWLTKYYDPDKTYPECREFSIQYLQRDPLVPRRFGNRILNGLRNRYLHLIMQYRLFRLIDKDTDIVNLHDNGMELIMLFAKLAGKRVVWQINDLPGCFLEGPANKDKDSLRKAWSRLKIRLLSRCADALTVNVTKNAQRIQKHFQRPAAVFYCGVDIREDLHMHTVMQDPNQIHLVSTGVFFPYRNYETLVRLVKYLRDTGHPCTLDIVGSTELDHGYTAKIQNMVKQFKLSDCIKIWGQVDEDTYQQIYRQADIFLFLNLNQSWGLAVFEAMSQGLPVLVSNSVGAIELLHHDEDALIVDPLNVREIAGQVMRLTDAAVYQRISRRAAQVVRDYTWEKLYNSKMKELFKKLSAQKKS